jgi:4-amino-4-deoxy-L-arabinose transferase-like glycosyltransferase
MNANGHARRLVIAAAATGVALRLAFGLLYWNGKPLTHDEHEYLALAESVQAGRGFVYAEGPAGTTQQFGRAPGYPVFLAALGAGGRHTSSPARVKVAQALLGGLLVWIIAGLAARAAGPRAGIIAAWLSAIHPPLAWIAAYVLSETLYAVTALASALVLQIALDRMRGGRRAAAIVAGAGLLIGVGILVRPALLFFVPLAAAWLLLKRQTLAALILIAATTAVVAPWTARNVRVYGRFVLVASEGGVTFWTGNHPLARGEGDLAANPDLKAADLEFRRRHAGLTGDQLEPLYYREALEHIRADPGWWLGLLARKAFYTVVPAGPSYTLHSARYRTASVVPYLMLLPFAVIGAVRLRRSATPPAALCLLAGSAVLVSIGFFPQERFRIPVLDPALIVCAAAAGARHRI